MRGDHARLDDPLEHATENMPLAEALVARTQERRVIRDRILDTELAEPAVGGVHLHFTADQQPAKSLSYPATEAA